MCSLLRLEHTKMWIEHFCFQYFRKRAAKAIFINTMLMRYIWTVETKEHRLDIEKEFECHFEKVEGS